MSNTQFQKLVDSGKPIGEVIGTEKFLVKMRGLQPINLHSVVIFDDGSKGYVHHVYEDYVIVLHLGSKPLPVGTVGVQQFDQLVTRVGKNYVGRVINVLGEPLDGKGPIQPDGTWPIFHTAPMLYERELVDTPLETGIITLDIMFSIVRGQRMSMLGDSKSGKSSLATQIAINQRSTDITTIYVLIGRRRADVIELIDRLENNNAMDKTIVVAATMFESLIMNYLAPYVGAALGEYLWQHLDMDTLIIYDDLTNHAMAYREISLIAGVSPGRDSYPGDMFYTHSQLVERAGKLAHNHAAQTIIPIVYAPGGDITAYLPTNVMSMTDGQWILDMEVFKEIMRPAVSTGMSVTRVGGVGHNKRQKALAVATGKALAAYRQADEYAHFGSELSPESEANFRKGKTLFRLFNQTVGETYNAMEQQLLLDIILNMAPGESLDMDALKKNVHEYAGKVENDDDEKTSNFNRMRDELKSKCLVQATKAEVKKEADKTNTEDGESSESESKKEDESEKKSDAKDEEKPKPKSLLEKALKGGKKDDAKEKDKPAGKKDESKAEKTGEDEDEKDAEDKKSDEASKHMDTKDSLTPGELVPPNGEKVDEKTFNEDAEPVPKEVLSGGSKESDKKSEDTKDKKDGES